MSVRAFIPKRKRIWALCLLGGIFLFALISCGPTKLTLSRASLKPKGLEATPTLITAQTNLAEWQKNIKPGLQKQLQEHIYGVLPDSATTQVTAHRVIAEQAFNGTARLEEYTLVSTAHYGETATQTPPYNMVVLTPLATDGPVPVILMQTFCPNHNTIPHPDVGILNPQGFNCSGKGFGNKLIKYVFGRYITAPPIEMIMQRGYALATIFPSEFIPDGANSGLSALKKLTKGHDDPQTRMGAIAAWGWGYSRMVDILGDDPRFDEDGFFAFGHSRYGKAALVAAAYDERIDGVISHQSGTGGASLNKAKKGETVAEITGSYPHWFSARYGTYAEREQEMPTDQHALLALIAPRPLFLGNARRDVWSDPNGAFRAAIGATPVYKLYNKQGLNQHKLKPFTPDADISFYIRPGTHGIVKEDWPAFLDFLDAHTQ